MKNHTTRVFSYGSNMPYQRLKNRISDISLVGSGRVDGYKLVFHKISKDGSAKANLVKDDKESLFGVVYQLDISQKAKLDRYEGKGYGYEDATVLVHYPNKTSEEVFCYIVIDDNYTNNTLKPYHWYKALVVAGAREHQLPQNYIQSIEKMESEEDPNQSRREKNHNLLKAINSTK